MPINGGSSYRVIAMTQEHLGQKKNAVFQADQIVLSLRLGGGSHGGTRFLGPRFDPSSEANTDLPVLLRPHGGGRASFPFFKA